MDIKTLTPADLTDLFTTQDPAVIARLLPTFKYENDGEHMPPEALGLTWIGDGSCATIIAHPHDPSLTIRVSEETDGWITYACGGGEDHTARPHIFALGWTGQCWVAVSERLCPAVHVEAQMFLDYIEAALLPNARRVPSEEAIWVADDISARRLPVDDLYRNNVMSRPNGDIVLNDPLSHMSIEQMLEMKSRFTTSCEDTPSPM